MKRSKYDLAVGLFVAFGLMSLVFLALKVGNLAGYDSGDGYGSAALCNPRVCRWRGINSTDHDSPNYA